VHISEGDWPILFMVGEHDKPERNAPCRKKLKSGGINSEFNIYKDGKQGCWNRLSWFNEMAADMDAFFRNKLR
jgi:gluconolactonase